MSDPLVSAALPDAEARLRIREELDRNLLVEAGAGSGKTTALVDRMVALIRSRACTVGELAAVTFTRKAAAELRQRFQEELERVAATLPADEPERGLLEQAIRDIDSSFLGTIHAFCAKLLRERPLEAGLDPGFREVLESEAYRMQRRFWVEFLERLAADGDLQLRELERLGIAPDRLQGVFEELVENPDVDFGFDPVEAPDPDRIQSVREVFDALLDRAEVLMPDSEPAKGWDSFTRRVRTLLYWRRSLDWNDRNVFFDALGKVYHKKDKPTQNRWSETGEGKAAAKKLGEDFQAFSAPRSEACRLVEAWYAYRYPIAVGLAKRAADAFALQRKDQGTLNFQDLLVLSADLLREDPIARRDLGLRYRRILVDEFQDTDPLQAEIILLLASNPGSSQVGPSELSLEGGLDEDWRDVIPRPGALFVVGDPKQSIYRFRRADIALYEFVKGRFEAFGALLRLDANFRSLRAIEDVVQGVFDHEDGFPAEDTDRQAAFAPLLTQRAEGPGLLATYPVRGRTQADVARDDAEGIASCILARVGEGGDRQPGDFMILTRTRKHLSLYARALEDRNLPVEVSGAGVGFEDELAALLLLLRCLADPAHAVRVLGVLTGPFFGITLDELVRYRDEGGTLVINRAPRGQGSVDDALGLLHGWWLRAQRDPSDVTFERLVREIGLFPLAAAGPLGQLRAGALVYLADAVRGQALAGDTSIAGAVDAMETALAWEDAESPLVPGRRNAVQVMNVHRAKGLEADVVFLAAPFGETDRSVEKRISRDREGVAHGTLLVVDRDGFRRDILARPITWVEDEEEERAFQAAENTRLLYVAATRARDELWVARGSGLSTRGESPWQPVEEWLDEAGYSIVELPRDERPEPDRLDPGVPVAGPIQQAALALERAAVATYELETVTARTKTDDPAPPDADDFVHVEGFSAPAGAPTTGGFEWGSVVHTVLAAAGEGMGANAVAQIARDALIELERPVDGHGQPTELDALLTLVEAVRSSEVWARAMASAERYTEMPFAVNRSAPSEAADVIEGVIDLVFKEQDGHWVVADYKTDTGTDPEYDARVHRYRRQVDLYADCWEQVTGEAVGERVLVFTTQGRTEAW